MTCTVTHQRGSTLRERERPARVSALERSRTHAKLQAQVERCKEVLREAQATLHVSSVVCVAYVRTYLQLRACDC